MSLLHRLLLLVSLALVPAALIAAVSAIDLRVEREARAVADARRLAARGEAERKLLLDDLWPVLGTLAATPAIAGGDTAACRTALETALEDVEARLPRPVTVVVTNPDGTARCATGPEGTAERVVSAALSLSVPLSGADGTATGAVVARVALGPDFGPALSGGGMATPVAADEGGALAPARVEERATLAALAAVLSLTLLAVWWAGHRLVRRPVDALLAAADRWGDGCLSARSGLAGERSEIGALGRAFDAMAETLERQFLERERAEARVRKASEVLGSTTDAVIELNSDGRVTFLNDRARLLFADGRDVTGRRLRDALPALTAAPFADRFRRAVDEAEPDSFEEHCPALGVWFAARLFPSRDGLAVFLQDITDRRRDGEALWQQSDERFRAVFELAAVGIDRTTLDGRYLDANAKLCAILGYRREELLERSFRDVSHPEDRECEDSLIGGLVAGTVQSYAVERRYRRPDGSVVWARVTASLARGAVGEPAYRIAVVEDITERKAMEEALRAAKEEAERANLAKSKFLAAASHDLRQPLQSLFLFSAVLAGHVEGTKGANLLRHLDQGLEALKGLLDSLLEVSRLDARAVSPVWEDVAIGEELATIKAAFAPLAAEKGVELRIEPCTAVVRSDRTLLARLVRNLVENAVRFTAAGLVRVQCQREGARLAIVVQDTGIGIPADHMERIFEEFHQVGNPERDRARGLGLGLAIVRRLSRLLDHPVEARSVEGRGSAFRVLVPLGEAGSTATRNAMAAPTPVASGNGRLALLVDDDAVVLMGLQLTMREWGYEVVAAGSADQAMDRLAVQPRAPDIVIADYRLREGRVGTEVIARVRERYGGGVPGVILTGETGTECLADAAEHGFHVIQKPISPRELGAVVDQQMRIAAG